MRCQLGERVHASTANLLHVAALGHGSPEGQRQSVGSSRAAGPGLAASRAVLAAQSSRSDDTDADPDYLLKDGAQWGFRSVLGIP